MVELLKSIGPNYGMMIAGIIIIIIVLLRQLGQRQQKTTQRQREREKAIKAAQEAERKNQTQTCCGQQSKVVPPKTRMPLGNPLGTPFSGTIQGAAAKWEVEIHALGRQIIGQIDSKMAALQTITLDANRTANRLEILVEHLEQIARQQMEWQQSLRKQYAETEPPTAEPPTVIPVTAPVLQVAPLGNVLKELADDLEDIHETIKQSTVLLGQPEPATILRLPADTPYSNLRSEVEMLTNYGLDPQDIAQRLNISLGEVDLMQQAQQNRLDRTT